MSKRQRVEKDVTKSVSVTLDPGNEYNIVRPAVATVRLTDQSCAQSLKECGSIFVAPGLECLSWPSC
jgi:hypothetical protein